LAQAILAQVVAFHVGDHVHVLMSTSNQMVWHPVASTKRASVYCCAILSLGKASTIWEVGQSRGHVEVLESLPSHARFFGEYLQGTGDFAKVGKPVLFSGAARNMPAYNLWTDDYLRDKHGDVLLDQVEPEKKETRTVMAQENWTLRKFLDSYADKDIYSTAITPRALSEEVYLLPFMNCGGYLDKLQVTVLWFSSGGTSSVIHSDSQQNVHCMLAGTKHWILWRPDEKIDSREYGWIVAEDEGKRDPQFKDAYGQFAGRINVSDVDLKKYPGWNKMPRWEMTLRAGDCAFIPKKWYHYVESTRQRSISVHVWFHSGNVFEGRGCDELEAKLYNSSDFVYSLGDCTFRESRKRNPTCRLPKERLVRTEL